MRGKDEQQLDVFSYVSPEQRVPHDHPLRPLRAMTDEAFRELQPRFHKLYAKTGSARPDALPDQLNRAAHRHCDDDLYGLRKERAVDSDVLFEFFRSHEFKVSVRTYRNSKALIRSIAHLRCQELLQNLGSTRHDLILVE